MKPFPRTKSDARPGTCSFRFEVYLNRKNPLKDQPRSCSRGEIKLLCKFVFTDRRADSGLSFEGFRSADVMPLVVF